MPAPPPLSLPCASGNDTRTPFIQVSHTAQSLQYGIALKLTSRARFTKGPQASVEVQYLHTFFPHSSQLT